MSQTSFDYKKERSALSLKYSIDLDETSASILFVLREEQTAFFAAQNTKLEAAAARIKYANNSLQAAQNNPRAQAFWFGMGKWGLALIFGISIGSCLYMYQMSQEDQALKTAALLNWYGEYYKVSQNGSKKGLVDFLKNYPMPK